MKLITRMSQSLKTASAQMGQHLAFSSHVTSIYMDLLVAGNYEAKHAAVNGHSHKQADDLMKRRETHAAGSGPGPGPGPSTADTPKHTNTRLSNTFASRPVPEPEPGRRSRAAGAGAGAGPPVPGRLT